MGRICLEEFNEILLLAGNGYGFGALKILRNMYERAVTSAYLLQNPDKGDQFNNYHNIHLYRATNHLANLAGLALQLAPEFVAQIKAGYEAVRKDYEEEICKACHKTRVRYSWSPLDTASMARKAGKNYSDLYYSAYYNPTLQTHTTVASVIARLEQNHDDSIGFNRGPQRAEADRAVRLAHDLLLLVVAEQNERFKLGLDAEIHDRAAEFLDVYKHTGKATISADPESKSSGE